MKKILVWDAPVRLGHWAMVFAFATAYLTHDSERWRLVHVNAGYVFFALLLFRFMWGFTGTRFARFHSFLFRPSEVAAYVRSLFSGRAEHWTGHNPAGSYAIFAILATGFLTTLTGMLTYFDIGGELTEEPHEILGNFALFLVGLHVAGVFVGSLLHRENLVRAMITGRKLGHEAEAIPGARTWAVFLLAGFVVLAASWLNTF